MDHIRNLRTSSSAPRQLFKRSVIMAAVLGALAAAAPLSAQNLSDFQNPPNAARPRTWWHWMNGNISKEGITADLQWMHQAGLGGFQNFDAAMFTPRLVEQRLTFMSAEWKDAFKHAITLADQLGLEAGIAGSPGWSESGGPWVQPHQGMKKLVWTETTVNGGSAFTGKLAAPPSVPGPFMDAPPSTLLDNDIKPEIFYKDAAVLAFRVPAAEAQPPVPVSVTTDSGAAVDVAALADNSMLTSVHLPRAAPGASSAIQFDYGSAVTMRGVTWGSGAKRTAAEHFGAPAPGPVLESSSDGSTWQTVVEIPGDGAVRHTIAFAPVTARYFRARFTTPAGQPMADAVSDFDEMMAESGATVHKPAPYHMVAALQLHQGARVQRGEEKAGFAALADFDPWATPDTPADTIVARNEVIDLSEKMRADGSLDWTPPAGTWTVLRMGYSLTGMHNNPASPEGTGLEVDKLNATHVRAYLNHYLGLYRDASGGLMGKRGLQYMVNDSWEAGSANWTDDMLEQFARRRGYAATPWLPVLAGRVVGSAAQSDAFLWDWRQTLADMVSEHHYGVIADELHARGMGHYAEAHETKRALIADGMDMKRRSDIPMSAMWTQSPGVNADVPNANADIRESASVAHIYGQNLVAAESLTAIDGPWRWSPATLKPSADKEMAMGVNRFMIHTSVHQPLMDKLPGISLGPFGQWFNRNETWAGAGARAWTDYLARSSWMLQQGRFVADVAWFYGEDTNITARFGKEGPAIPEGHNFDYVNADVLRHRFTVSDGQLATASGMRYRVLVLDPRVRQISLPVLEALRKLVIAGATVAGHRPLSSPSLLDDQARFQAIVAELWGAGDTTALRKVGKGGVIAGDVSAALAALNVTPDFSYTRPQADTSLLAVHRKLKNSDLYFVNSRNDRAQQLEASFRITGKVPELWHADTGRSEPVAWRVEQGRTVVALNLHPWDAVFVVFRQPTRATSGTLPATRRSTLATLDGSWDVSFQAGRGAPAQARLPLGSWTGQNVDGIKYFSGVGTYQRTLEVPAYWLGKGKQLWLDLGQVGELAEVKVNGKSLGVAWRPPYRIDVSTALRAGRNDISIAVANTWGNRLTYDARKETENKLTFIVPRLYKGKEALTPSGLIGPVTLERIEPNR